VNMQSSIVICGTASQLEMLDYIVKQFLEVRDRNVILHSAGHVLELVHVRDICQSDVTCRVYVLKKLLYRDCEVCRRTLSLLIYIALQMGVSVVFTESTPLHDFSPSRVSHKHFMEFLLQYEKYFRFKKVLEEAKRKFNDIVEEIIAECVRGGVVRVLDEEFREKIERAVCLAASSETAVIRELLRKLYTSTFVDKVLKRRSVLRRYCKCKHVVDLLSISSLQDVAKLDSMLSEAAPCVEELRLFVEGR